MKKHCIYIGLGDYYNEDRSTGYINLPFIYKNIADLSYRLNQSNWISYPPLLDETATKTAIIRKLSETINACSEDDWLLLYFTGHADLYFQKNTDGTYSSTTFCVTSTPQLSSNFTPPISEFFSQKDYAEIISSFHNKATNGHLLTVLDCCYAFGMIENFSVQHDYHTILAASSETSKAFYKDNSFFFQALSQSWNLTNFGDIGDNITSLLANTPNHCSIEIAKKFSNQSF